MIEPQGIAKPIGVSDHRPAAPTHSLVVPVEDTCAGAQIIPTTLPHLTTPVDSTDASHVGDPPPTQCAGIVTPITDFSRGIWFQFTPAVTAPYSFNTCPSVAPDHTLTDSILSIYTSSTGACGGTFAPVACNDDAGAGCALNGRASSISGLVLNAGVNYFILAWRWDDADGGEPGQTTQIHVSQTPPPANDACAGAVPLALNRSVGATLVAAQNDYTLDTSGGTACFQGIGHVPSTAPGRDVVFSFTAPAAGSYSFRSQQRAAAGNTVLYTSPTCPAPGAITCDASVHANNRSTTTGNLSGAEEQYCQTLAEGETTYIIVDEHVFTGAGGLFAMEALSCDQEVEGNGDPASANLLDSCPVEGTITAGDADFWSLGSPAAGSRVFAQVDGVASNPAATLADFDMRITTGTDTLEYDDADNHPGWGSFSPNIAGRALTGDASYVRVDYFPPGGNFEPYRLVSVIQPPGGDPYGSSATAEVGDAPSTLGGAQSAGNGYFHGTHLATPSTNGYDLDIYKFCAMNGDVISVGADGDPARNLSPYDAALFLLDQNGSSIAGITNANNVSNNTPGAGNLAATTPHSPAESITWRSQYTGPYYAMVEFFGPGGPAPPPGTDYLLSVGANCQPTSVRTALLGTTLTTETPTAEAGGELVYIVHIENNGTDQALDAEFTDVLPPGVLFEGIFGDGADLASCSQVPAPGTNGTVRCRVECLRPGGSFDFFIVTTTPACTGDGELTNTVTVTTKTTLVEGSVLEASTTTPITDPGTCDDGSFCTASDHCEEGACVGSFACEDNDPCTIDTCSEEDGCSNDFAEGNLCDDGNPCTLIDICLLGDVRCVGFEEITCDDSSICTDDTCSSEVPGECVFTPADCEDGDACTTNSCDEVEGCVSSPIVCDDGSACTADSCDSGTGCVYTPIVCDDGDGCTTDTCDDGTGCVYSPIVCDDGDVCTADSCSDGACVYDPIPGCGSVCTSTDNPKNVAYWKRLCRGQSPGGDTITLADASCVASQGTTFAFVDEVKDICDTLAGDVGISNSCSAANAQLMALALNVCHQRVCDSTAIDSQYSDNTTVGESYDEADGYLSNPTGSGCQLAKNLASEINGGRAVSSFVGSSSDTQDTTIEPEDRRIRTIQDR